MAHVTGGVLLAEYLALAVIAGAAGVIAGRVTAPLLTDPGAGLLGAAGTPQLTLPVTALVVGMALAVATLASYAPALRAARTSTVDALADLGLSDVGFISQTARENQVLLVITVLLVALAAVNIIFITWATVQDSRHATALTRALGATARQLTISLSAVQIFPATAGALAGIAAATPCSPPRTREPASASHQPDG